MYKALQLLEWLELDIDEEASPEARKLARTLHEFDHYIRTNQSSIPMRWTRRGAHLLLQVRTRVLDNTFTAIFQRW